MQFSIGLVSISFRKYTPNEILQAAKSADLQAIEWGGDVHVPCGDYQTARAVGQASRNLHISTPIYGSYFTLGKDLIQDFPPILKTALALQAPCIRIWAGTKASASYSDSQRKQLIQDADSISKMAQAEGIALTLELHPHTLTDHWQSTLEILQAVSPAIRVHWQPNQYLTQAENISAIQHLKPYISHSHVFHWDTAKRYPLSDGISCWEAYLQQLKGTQPNLPLLLEFMPDDSLESLNREAQTLRQIIQNVRL